MEEEAFLSFLQIFNFINDLDSCGSCCCEHGCDDLYKSGIESALRINHAGRCLMEVDGNNDDNGRSIPLSLWPTLLERSYAKSGQNGIYQYCCEEQKLNKNATGLYYLLREGPVLISRPNDDASSLSNDNKPKKNEQNLLKRKRP